MTEKENFYTYLAYIFNLVGEIIFKRKLNLMSIMTLACLCAPLACVAGSSQKESGEKNVPYDLKDEVDKTDNFAVPLDDDQYEEEAEIKSLDKDGAEAMKDRKK